MPRCTDSGWIALILALPLLLLSPSTGAGGRCESALPQATTWREGALRDVRPPTPTLSPQGGEGVRGELAALPQQDAADKPAAADKTRDKLNAEFDASIARWTKTIAGNPRDIDSYSRRGDAHFFRGKFVEAVADFDRMIELNPEFSTSHWRRGIALFYANRFKDAAKQFEVYHSFDNVDRENGIWRYLSQVKAYGREKAREGLLKYTKDDRQPFPDVYRMFAGDLTGDEVLKRIKDAKISPEEREKRLFYAELYVGLNEYVNDHLDVAEKHLKLSTDNSWGTQAGGGPGWMWHVGRVHHDLLVDRKK